MPVGCWRAKSVRDFYLHQTRARMPFPVKPQTSTRTKNEIPIPLSARSEAWVCCLSRTEGMDICLLSGRGPCVGLITPLEEPYWVWCVWVWSWIPDSEEALVSDLLRRKVEMKWQNWINNAHWDMILRDGVWHY